MYMYKQTYIHVQTDRETDTQTGGQTERQRDIQIDRHTDRHTDRQTDRQTDKVISYPFHLFLVQSDNVLDSLHPFLLGLVAPDRDEVGVASVST